MPANGFRPQRRLLPIDRMDRSTEAWTDAHDLALIFLALAYGADQELSDDELDTLTDALAHWEPMEDRASIRTIVLEALTLFVDRDVDTVVHRAVMELAESLDQDELRHALEQVVHIAEADGILLSAEQTLITELGRAWSLKQLSDRLLSETTATVEDVPAWSLLHDLVLVYVVLAHSTDGELSSAEIDEILERIRAWLPEEDEEKPRDVMRDVLRAYSEEPDETVLRQSVQALKDWLPPIQRILVLDDLNHIARADGAITSEEREMIRDLAKAWKVSVRISSNGQMKH